MKDVEVEALDVEHLEALDFGDVLSETKQGGPPFWQDGTGSYGLGF